MTANIAREGNFAVKAFSIKCVAPRPLAKFSRPNQTSRHNSRASPTHALQIRRQGAAALLALHPRRAQPHARAVCAGAIVIRYIFLYIYLDMCDRRIFDIYVCDCRILAPRFVSIIATRISFQLFSRCLHTAFRSPSSSRSCCYTLLPHLIATPHCNHRPSSTAAHHVSCCRMLGHPC